MYDPEIQIKLLCFGGQIYKQWRKGSTHNNGEPVIYFLGPSTQLITHRVLFKTTPAPPHISALPSRISDLATPEQNQRGFNAGF